MTDTLLLCQLAMIEGKQAAVAGKTYNDNPYARGFTKLGAIKPSDETRDQFEAWIIGLGSIGRPATPQEVADALRYDPSQFKRKSNRFYANR
jgi:hypothetical protein